MLAGPLFKSFPFKTGPFWGCQMTQGLLGLDL